MIHLYAVVEGLDELPPVAGLSDAPLERLRVRDLDVVVSDTPPGGPVGSDESVLRHALVVEELMQRSAAVLPGRLGQAFPDTRALTRAVRADADRLRTALHRVRGCVELGLRVMRPEPETDGAPEPRGGAEYMHARLAETRELDRLAAEIDEPLARLSRASARRPGESPRMLLDAAYLVPLDGIMAFRAEVSRLESSRAELAFVCTGPWPPYSFASGDREEGT
jgi:hypothetical protein